MHNKQGLKTEAAPALDPQNTKQNNSVVSQIATFCDRQRQKEALFWQVYNSRNRIGFYPITLFSCWKSGSCQWWRARESVS